MDNIIVLTESQLRELVTQSVDAAMQRYIPLLPSSAPGKETLSVEETSEYLRISESTVRKMIREKKLPFNRIRGQLFAQKREIDAWIRDGRAALDGGDTSA